MIFFHADLSHYEYEATSNVDDRDLEFHLESRTKQNFRALDRRRRSPIDPIVETSTTTKSVLTHHDQPLITTKSNASVKVSYSTTEQNETYSTTTTSSSTTTTTMKSMIGKGVIVSTPIVPSINKNDTKNYGATTNVNEPKKSVLALVN